MNNWQTKKLGEVADILMGQSPPSSTYNNSGGGLPFFQGKADFNDLYPTINMYCSQPVRVAVKNDVLLSVRAPVGPVNLSPSEICIGRGLSAIRGKNNILNQMYLFYFMKLNELALSKKGTGSTFSSINRKDIEMIELPLPSLSIQQQIVERIDAIKKMQELNQKEIEKTEELFISFLRTRFAKQTGWKTENICNVTNIFGGGTPSKGNPKYWNGSIPWVSPKDMKSSEISSTEDYISEEAIKNSSTNIVPEKASLIVFRSGILQHSVPIAITKRKVALNQDMKALVCSDRLNNEYLFYWLLGHKPEIKSCIKTGGTVQSIDSKRFYALALSYPDLKIQKQIVLKVESIFLILKEKQDVRDLLKELFESTLHRLLSNKQYEQ